MLGLAISAGAAFGLSVAGAAINPQMALVALAGLLAGAVLLSVGALAFGTALKIAAPAFDGVDWKKVPMAMLGLAISVGAAVGMALAGAAIAPLAIPGSIGLLAGAVMLSVGALAYSVALRLVSAVMPDNMKEIAAAFLLLGLTVAATIPMALAATALTIPATTGIGGAVTGAVFLTVGAVAYSLALRATNAVMDGIDMGTTAKNMGLLALVMIATVPMALAAALLTIPAVLGLIGLLPAAGFLYGVAKILGPAMEAFQAMPLNAKKVGENALALAAAMGALVVTALTAVLLVPFAVPFIGSWLMKKGLELIGDFMYAIGDNLVGPLAAFAAMPIPASASLGKKIDLINAGIEGVGTIGNIAIGLAQIDTAAVEEGGKQGDTIKAITDFINVLLGGITEFITVVADLASSIPSENVGSLKAISGILTSLGGLFKAFSPSDEAMAAVKEAAGSWGGDEVGLMNGIAQMQKDAMAAAVPLFNAAGEFITTIVNAVDGVDVSGAGPILEAIPNILTAIGSLLKAMAPSEGEMAAVNEATNSWGGDEVGLMEAMNERMTAGITAMIPLIKTIANEFGKLITNHLTPMIAVIGSLGVDGTVISAVADIIGALMGAMSNMLQAIGPIMEVFQGSLENNIFGPSKAEQMSAMMADFGTMMGHLSSAFTDMLPKIQSFVVGVVALAQGIGDPKKSSEALKVVAQAIDLLSVVTKSLLDTMNMIIKLQGGDTLTDTVKWMFREGGMMDIIVTGVGRGIDNFFEKLKPVARGIGDPKKGSELLDVIAKAVGLLAVVTDSTVKAMNMIIKVKDKSGDSLTENVKWMFKEGGMMDQIVNGIGGGIQILFAHLDLINIPDPNSAGKKMDVIAKAVEVSATLLGAVDTAMSIAKKLGKGDTLAKNIETVFKPNTGLMAQIVNAMGQGIQDLMLKILVVTDGIPNPAKAEKQVGVLAKIMEVVGSFAGAIESMGGMAVPGKGKTKQVSDVVAMVGDMTGALVTNMPILVNGLLDVIKGSGSGMTSLYKYRHSIATMGDLMCSVGQFATAIEALQGLGGSGGGGAEKVLENMASLFDPADGAAFNALTNIIGSMVILSPALAALPKEAGPRLKNIVEVISAMDGLTAAKVTTITETIEEVKSLLGTIGDDEMRGVVNLANVLAKPGKQTLTLKTVTPHIKATFVVNIDSKKLGEAVAAEGGVVASGDGSK